MWKTLRLRGDKGVKRRKTLWITSPQSIFWTLKKWLVMWITFKKIEKKWINLKKIAKENQKTADFIHKRMFFSTS